MLRRLLIVAGIGLALAGTAHLALRRLAAQRFEARRTALLERALFPPSARRPWEVRFEALSERIQSSSALAELEASPYRPEVAWGGGPPRALDDFERVWIEATWDQLAGLDATLTALRALPAEDRTFGGATVKLSVLRACVNAALARAWLALEEGDAARASQGYGDALRLAEATDEGSSFATLLRFGVERSVLCALRSALVFGTAAQALEAELAPLLAGWSLAPEKLERCLGRDLAVLADFDPLAGEPWYDEAQSHAGALRWLAPVEEAFALARTPPEGWPPPTPAHAPSSELDAWTLAHRALRERQALGHVARSALAVAAFHELHGAWPGSLEELATLPEEARLDPFTRAPIPYSVVDGAATLGPIGLGARDASDTVPDLWVLRSATE